MTALYTPSLQLLGVCNVGYENYEVIFVSLGRWTFQAVMRNTEDRISNNKIDRYESKEDQR